MSQDPFPSAMRKALVLPDDIAAFIESGVSIILAVVGPDGRAKAGRAVATRVVHGGAIRVMYPLDGNDAITASAQSGGPIATVPAAGNARSPRDAIYRVRISLDGAPVNSQVAVGEVVIDGVARAWLPSILEGMAAILIRESGF